MDACTQSVKRSLRLGNDWERCGFPTVSSWHVVPQSLRESSNGDPSMLEILEILAVCQKKVQEKCVVSLREIKTIGQGYLRCLELR